MIELDRNDNLITTPKESFKTFIFQEKRKIDVNGLIETVLLGSAILAVIIFNFLGMAIFGWSTAIALIVALIKLKKEDNKNKGLSKYGSRKANLIINEDSLIINDIQISFDEMEELSIYVDEYYGMSKHLVLRHHGGNNEIRFVHNSKTVSFNYLIATESDYHFVEKLVSQIEERYPIIK